MPTRLRKVRKKRGSRYYGYGQIGQHRGGGSRGGRGRVGRKRKHLWTARVMVRVRKKAVGKKYEEFLGLERKKRSGKYVKLVPVRDYFGKKGFFNPNVNIYREMTLAQVQALADKLEREGKAERVDGMVVVDVTSEGVGKVIDKGKITKQLLLIAPMWTKGVEEKVAGAGGKVVKPGEVKVR